MKQYIAKTAFAFPIVDKYDILLLGKEIDVHKFNCCLVLLPYGREYSGWNTSGSSLTSANRKKTTLKVEIRNTTEYLGAILDSEITLRPFLCHYYV